MVSAHRYDEVIKRVWTAGYSKEVKGYYFYSSTGNHGKQIALHRFLKGDPPGKFVDHENHDLFDCRDENLRVADFAQSAHNRQKYSHSTQRYKGVRRNGKTANAGWRGMVTCKGKSYYTRSCSTEREAVIERNKLVLKLHGEFGYLEELLPEENYATTTA